MAKPKTSVLIQIPKSNDYLLRIWMDDIENDLTTQEKIAGLDSVSKVHTGIGKNNIFAFVDPRYDPIEIKGEIYDLLNPAEK